MKYTPEEVQKVRDISISQMLGLQMGRSVLIKCPHPNHNDSTPSFQVRKDNSFICYGCGLKGRGWIDFCTVVFEKQFNEIMNEFK